MGVRDNLLYGRDTVFWIYQILRCNNEFRARTMRDECEPTDEDDCYDYDKNDDGSLVDEECAPEEEITEWLQDKVLYSKMMNSQIDFEIANESKR